MRFSINLHAHPDELIDFAVDNTAAEVAFLTGIQFTPRFKAVFLGMGSMPRENVVGVKPLHRLCITLTKPQLGAKTALAFVEQNDAIFIMDVGQLDESGLHESGVQGGAEDKAAVRVWRRLLRRLKRDTMTGVWAIDAETGERKFYRNHRHTTGARCLQAAGVRILPLVGDYTMCLKNNDANA